MVFTIVEIQQILTMFVLLAPDFDCIFTISTLNTMENRKWTSRGQASFTSLYNTAVFIHTKKRWKYLQEGMKPRLQSLTSDYGLFAHLKEVDKWWVGLHQLSRLRENLKKQRAITKAVIQSLTPLRTSCWKSSKLHHTHIFQNNVSNALLFRPVHHQLLEICLLKHIYQLICSTQPLLSVLKRLVPTFILVCTS